MTESVAFKKVQRVGVWCEPIRKNCDNSFPN